MDKYEYKVRADEIKELIAAGDYVQAAEIADTIDWRRVKSVMMLCTISDVYKINRRYEDAKNMLLLAYDRRPGGRTICFSLCELCIKTEEYVQAISFYNEFVSVAPKDPGRFILRYKLMEAQDVNLEERISVLEELKKRDYREKWAYELAYLYHRVGLATKCVEECDDLILWFGEGKYVIKAMELKMLHQPLTADQQRKYDNRFAPEKPGAVGSVPEQFENEASGDVQGYDEADETVSRDTRVYEAVYPEAELNSHEKAVDAVLPEVDKSVQVEEGEPEIQVKPMDVSAYNTINLQEELAAGLREVLEGEGARDKSAEITRSILAPLFANSDTESLDPPQIDEVSEGDLEEGDPKAEPEEMESAEVFFSETADIVLNQMQEEALAKPEEKVMTSQPPKELAHVLSQESDGQIRLVVPEEKALIEKQITGQMSFEDVFAEWERMKEESEKRRQEEVRQHVLQQTGAMFTEFEEAVRDGLLEKLENEKITPFDPQAAELQEEPVEEFAGEQTEELAEEPAKEFAEESAEELAEEPVEESAGEQTEELAEEQAEEFVEENWGEVEEIEEIHDSEDGASEEETEVAAEEETIAEEPDEWETETAEEEAVEEEVIEEEIAEEEAAEEEVVEEVPAVDRDPAKVRALTKEEKELYAPYIQSKADRESLVKAIDSISLAPYTGNIIITGEMGTDTFSLAKNMIREVQLTDSNFAGKVAKISGSGLNSQKIDDLIDHFKNGALIIQKATEMENTTVESINHVLQKDRFGIIIVLQDTKKAMDKFLAEHERFAEMFTARFHIHPMSDETLAAYGKQYAKEMEYAIDEFGMLALHTRIDELQTSDHAVTVVEVKEIVDEAIRRVNRKTLKHFFDVLFGKRYDDEDMIILGEKDFV